MEVAYPHKYKCNSLARRILIEPNSPSYRCHEKKHRISPPQWHVEEKGNVIYRRKCSVKVADRWKILRAPLCHPPECLAICRGHSDYKSGLYHKGKSCTNRDVALLTCVVKSEEGLSCSSGFRAMQRLVEKMMAYT